MKYIIKIKDETCRYDYNVWSVFEYDNGECSEDTRIFCSDDEDEFLEFLRENC